METKEYFEMSLNSTVNDLEKQNCDWGGLLDYLYDALEIEIKSDSQGQYIGAEILVTNGGPTVWVDTVEGAVVASWNGFEASRELSKKTNEFINSVIYKYMY